MEPKRGSRPKIATDAVADLHPQPIATPAAEDRLGLPAGAAAAAGSAAAPEIAGAEREMYGFETITFAPIDLALVEPSIMTTDEIAWLNAYHAKVREIVTPQVEGQTAAWLAEATRAI